MLLRAIAILGSLLFCGALAGCQCMPGGCCGACGTAAGPAGLAAAPIYQSDPPFVAAAPEPLPGESVASFDEADNDTAQARRLAETQR